MLFLFPSQTEGLYVDSGIFEDKSRVPTHGTTGKVGPACWSPDWFESRIAATERRLRVLGGI